MYWVKRLGCKYFSKKLRLIFIIVKKKKMSLTLTYCSDGSGAGTPLLINKYRIFSSCIFINTKLYAVNDIIIVKNEDTWFNEDIDHGAGFAYLCKKNMTLNDVYPLNPYASKPPQALIF